MLFILCSEQKYVWKHKGQHPTCQPPHISVLAAARHRARRHIYNFPFLPALQLSYSTEDCSFEEEIRPDGYNVYKSKKHGISVSLSSAKQRQQSKGKDFLPLSHFLPMINTVPVESTDFDEFSDYSQAFESDVYSSPLETDSMDPFGISSKLSPVKSPSFQK
ncbi:PREDICTED: fibroblast growth factor 19 [Tinamus guttatus]|uniref:fibroblast growth factor 19 n=1 Tax=Tinamus guttatus TaxID=94827 RepID=UPI00052E74D7|nr:PREDICTED: fibroblast growth factor 19 [Tinamus guttatus]